MSAHFMANTGDEPQKNQLIIPPPEPLISQGEFLKIRSLFISRPQVFFSQFKNLSASSRPKTDIFTQKKIIKAESKKRAKLHLAGSFLTQNSHVASSFLGLAP
uniref:hypothetical protein n=1 Tax=Cephaleuros parasiticus TaxID=173370 RepID=UPI001EDCE98F|nr:hypothetical protein MFQ79_pgp020 [Cephaleuros parasiticus]UIB39042.1 hypothetical protein [Cephaleuros parasiticus]